MQEHKYYLLPILPVQQLPGKSLLVEPQGSEKLHPTMSIWLPGLRLTPTHNHLSLTNCSIKDN